MSFKHFSNFQKSISFVLLISIILVFSCTSDNSVTSSNSLNKTSDLADISSDDHEKEGNDATANLIDALERIWEKVEPIFEKADDSSQQVCGIGIVIGYWSAGRPGHDPGGLSKIQHQYDFRDNYLSKSDKGDLYTKLYYILSIHGIQNNLIMNYPLEHISIMEKGIGISKELQYGTNDSKILFDKTTYDDCNNILKIYRNSENHKDIEPVLEYLEADLEKYYNKPKAEIAADFGF